MTARIYQIDDREHIVHGITNRLPSEDKWYSAVRKVCPDGGACAVSGGVLCEFFHPGLGDKEQAMGAGLPKGLVLGVKITNNQIWKGIVARRIQEFNVNVTEDGVQIDFDRQEVRKYEFINFSFR